MKTIIAIIIVLIYLIGCSSDNIISHDHDNKLGEFKELLIGRWGVSIDVRINSNTTVRRNSTRNYMVTGSYSYTYSDNRILTYLESGQWDMFYVEELGQYLLEHTVESRTTRSEQGRLVTDNNPVTDRVSFPLLITVDEFTGKKRLFVTPTFYYIGQ